MDIWESIGIIASIASINSVIPVTLSIYILVTEKRNRRRNLDKIRRFNPREKSCVVIIDVGDKDVSMRESVESWMYDQPEFKGYPKENIFHVPYIKILTESDIDDLLKKIRAVQKEVMSKGTRNIHLFVRGPLALSAMLGVEFKNCCPVIFYQRNTTTSKDYINWGPIQRPNRKVIKGAV